MMNMSLMRYMGIMWGLNIAMFITIGSDRFYFVAVAWLLATLIAVIKVYKEATRVTITNDDMKAAAHSPVNEDAIRSQVNERIELTAEKYLRSGDKRDIIQITANCKCGRHSQLWI